jgi:hypothetical protein
MAAGLVGRRVAVIAVPGSLARRTTDLRLDLGKVARDASVAWQSAPSPQNSQQDLRPLREGRDQSGPTRLCGTIDLPTDVLAE